MQHPAAPSAGGYQVRYSLYSQSFSGSRHGCSTDAIPQPGLCTEAPAWGAQEQERLAKEVTHLNETVFSKSFKPPSAWADREVKYKAEKRDWNAQLARLQGTIDRLRDENLGYREANKTAEFERRIKVRSARGH